MSELSNQSAINIVAFFKRNDCFPADHQLDPQSIVGTDDDKISVNYLEDGERYTMTFTAPKLKDGICTFNTTYTVQHGDSVGTKRLSNESIKTCVYFALYHKTKSFANEHPVVLKRDFNARLTHNILRFIDPGPPETVMDEVTGLQVVPVGTSYSLDLSSPEVHYSDKEDWPSRIEITEVVNGDVLFANLRKLRIPKDEVLEF